MPRLVTFGGLVVLGEDDGPIPTIRGRNLALLALLARSGAGGMTRERLASYLWPESDQDRARHSLDQALYRLRQILGSDLFLDGGGTLLPNRGILDGDVQRFTDALASGDRRRAVDEYAGPFLDGFHLSKSGEFERWADEERMLLHRQCVQALETLARSTEAEGDARDAVRLWLRLAAAEPLSARVTRESVQALARIGDRSGALELAERHVHRLARDIGAEPDPDLLRWMEDLRTRPAPAPSNLPSPTHASAEGPSQPETLPTGPPAPRRRVAWALGAAAVLVAALLWQSGAPVDPAPAVAVHEFENRTGDENFDPLAGLASDWVSAGLSQTGLVQVIRGPGSRARSVDRVEGRIYRVGDSLRAEVQILGEDGRVRTGLEPVWSAATSPSDLLEPLRAGVLGAVASLHDPRLRDWSGSALRPPDYDAYREFAAGMELHAVPRDLTAAEARFARAGALDPDYLIPRLWQAWTLYMMQDYADADSVLGDLVPQRDGMTPLERAWHDRIEALLDGDTEESYQAAMRMVEAQPGSAWTLSLANAAIDARRPAVAVQALERTGIPVLGLQREHGWTLLTAGYHRLGEYGRELEVAEEAIRLDGLGWGTGGPGVQALAALGLVPELTSRLERIRSMPPIQAGLPQGPSTLLVAVTELRAHGHAEAADELASRFFEPATSTSGTDPASEVLRAELLYELGRFSDARRVLDELSPEADDGRRRRLRGVLAARAGDEALARQIAEALASDTRPYDFGAAAFGAARIRAALGDDEEALALLVRAFAEGAKREAVQELHVTRDFDGLRSDRRFREVLDPHGRAPAGRDPGG